MLIELVCEYPQSLVMGASALIGAGAYAGYSIYEAKKKLGNKFKLDTKRLIDTAWQSVVAGVAAGTAIGCSWSAVLIAMVTGVGTDKICNKLSIKKVQLFNVIQIVGGLLNKRDRK